MTETSVQPEALLIEFCEEAKELLQELPDRLAEFSDRPTDLEPLHVVFRSVHTIKGNAGFFGLPVLKQFAHRLENSLDDLRHGTIEITPDLVRYLVQAVDVLSEMVADIEGGATDATIETRHEELLAEIEKAVEGVHGSGPEQRLLASILELADEMDRAESGDAAGWSRRLRDLAASAASDQSADEGTEEEGEAPLSRFLEKPFRCRDVDVSSDVARLLAVFAASDADEDPRPQGEAFLQACGKLAEIAQQQSMGELADRLTAVHHDFSTLYSSPLDLDPMLLSVIWERLTPALTALLDEQPDKGETATASRKPADEPKKESKGKPSTPSSSVKNRFLRVKEERIDTFLEDVSNLFITIERLKDLQHRMAERLKAHELVDELRQINATLSSQSTALQQSVVELRRVPVGELFSKFPRVARSLASKLGKQVDVHLDGADIEIDKSLVEDLDGPLMHMIRNVCDHGIELPEEREARGMPAVGNLWLSCSLTKTHVVITIRDDGRGIDPDRLREKAVRSGWHSPAAAADLSDQEAIELIFRPGMSTAEQVTEISGRGVGLDVVRTRLREHNGDVKVESRVGEGTTFRLEIPIRRAVVVVDGLLVREGASTFVLPFEFIREIVRIDTSDVSQLPSGPVVRVRGEPYAAKTLGELLGIDSADGIESGSYRDGVLVRHKTQTMFLMVQTVLGHRKVVVSDLAAVLPQCERISGVAQLGGGKLALVVNPGELLRAAGTAEPSPTGTRANE